MFAVSRTISCGRHGQLVFVLFHELLHQRPGGLVIAALDRCSYRTHVIALLFEPVKVAELPHSCISTQLCGPGWKGIHREYHNDQESQYG